MRLRRAIDHILELLLITFLTTLVIDVIWQVASRYLLSDPSKFTDELAGFLLVWVSLLGAAYVSGKNQHLAINVILNKMQGKRKTLMQVAINMIIFLFVIFVFIIGGTWLVYTRFYLGQISPALELPLGYVYLVLPVSGIFILYYTIDNTLLELKGSQG